MKKPTLKHEVYLNASVEQLIDDPVFLNWVLNPNPNNSFFLDNLLKNNPDQKDKFQQAVSLIRQLHNQYVEQEKQIPFRQIDTSWKKVESKIVHNKSRRIFLLVISAACIAGLFFFIWTGYWENENQLIYYSTGNGKRIDLFLPDSSQVTLNANSEISYEPSLWSQGTRSVNLKGEAYFKVSKMEGKKFDVLANNIKITVVGTEFNVSVRDEKSEIVLEEGKVALDIGSQHFDMEPGDLITYIPNHKKVEAKKVKTFIYTAWKDGMMVYNDPLLEVVKELELLYGVTFKVKDPDLLKRLVQISAPADDLEQVLNILTLIFKDKMEIHQENNIIYLNQI